LHGEAAGEPVIGVISIVSSHGIFLASPVLAILNLEHVDQISIGDGVESEERSGRVKVDLNRRFITAIQEGFAVVAEVNNIEVPSSN